MRSRRAASSLTVAGRFGGTEHEGRVADAYSPRLQHAQVHASEPLDAQVRMIDPAQGPGTEALTKLFAAEMRFRRHFEQRVSEPQPRERGQSVLAQVEIDVEVVARLERPCVAVRDPFAHARVDERHLAEALRVVLRAPAITDDASLRGDFDALCVLVPASAEPEADVANGAAPGGPERCILSQALELFVRPHRELRVAQSGAEPAQPQVVATSRARRRFRSTRFPRYSGLRADPEFRSRRTSGAHHRTGHMAPRRGRRKG